jgi:hypothetical protein
MREMQRREQGRFVAGIQRRHEAVEYDERRTYRGLIGPGLSLVDGDNRSPSGEIREAGARSGGSEKRQPTAARKMRI